MHTDRQRSRRPWWCQKNARTLFAALWFAAATPVLGQATLEVGYAMGYPGTNSTSYVPMALLGTTDVIALQFDLTFDPERIHPPVATPHLLGSVRVRSRQIQNDRVRVVAYSLDGRPLSAERAWLARLQITVDPREHLGSGNIDLTNPILARTNATRVLPVETIKGSITIQPVNVRTNGWAEFFLKSDDLDLEYEIEASTDLIDWVFLTKVTAVTNYLDLVDEDAAAYPRRFYRWRRN